MFNDTVEQSRMELTQALNAAFPRDQYIIDGDDMIRIEEILYNRSIN